MVRKYLCVYLVFKSENRINYLNQNYVKNIFMYCHFETSQKNEQVCQLLLPTYFHTSTGQRKVYYHNSLTNTGNFRQKFIERKLLQYQVFLSVYLSNKVTGFNKCNINTRVVQKGLLKK